jgi:hypothetical protein
VADIKEKVLDFLHIPRTTAAKISSQQRTMIQILNVDYVIVCATSGPPTSSGNSATMTHAENSTITKLPSPSLDPPTTSKTP